MSSNAVADNFLACASARLHQSQKTIATCLGKLTDDQVWHRGGDHENSIANLLLHLEGNLRQWILHGIDNQPDIRQRDAEFTLTPTIHPPKPSPASTRTLDEAARIIAALSPDRLLVVIDPQPTGPCATSPSSKPSSRSSPTSKCTPARSSSSPSN